MFVIISMYSHNLFSQQNNCFIEEGWHLENESVSASGIPADYSGRLEIAGTVIIDRHQYFRNCQIYMHPLSKILVSGGAHLEVIIGTTIEACGDVMWHGIGVNPLGQLTFHDATIKDAVNAITAMYSSKIGVSYSTFDRNSIAINIPGPQIPYTVNLTVPLSYNKFLATEPLKYPSTGGLTTGIVVTGGLTVSKENIFSGLHTGIIANCNYLTVEQSGFFNSNGDGETGVGINASDLTLITKGCQFTNLATGIVGRRCGGFIEENVVWDVEIGFAFKFGSPNGTLTIRKNTKFAASGVGIQVEASNDMRGLLISENKIISNNVGPGVTFFGISIFAATVRNNARITNCTIRISEGVGIGILVGSCAGVTVDNCTIDCLTGAVTSFGGIEVQGGWENTFRENTIYGPAVGPASIDSKGISLWATSNNKLLCNTTNNTKVGMYVRDYCGVSPLVNNRFGIHSVGLQLNRMGIIGDQNHHFNQWQGNYSPDLGALHEAFSNQPFVNLSRFRVHTNYSGFYPTPVIPDLQYNGVVWFEVVNVQIDITDCNGTITGLTGPDDSLFLAINDDEIYQAPGEEAQLFQVQGHLYKYLLNNPGYYGEHPEFTSFFESHSASNINAFLELVEGIDSLFELPQSTTDSIEAGLDSLYEKLTGIETHVSLYESLPQDSIASWTEQFLQLQNDATGIARSIPLACDAVFALVPGKIQELQAKNEAIEPEGDHEIFEKEINAIWLSTVAQGNVDFSGVQLTVIECIAAQCPSTKGNAVFRARALYSMAYPVHEPFMDDCDPPAPRMGTPLNQDTRQPVGLIVSPNPARGSLSLVFDTPAASQQTLSLTAIAGNRIRNWEIAADTKSVQLEVGDVPEGIYYLSISEKGKTLHVQTIVLIR